MLRKTAKSLDGLVDSLPNLKAALKRAEALSDAAFKRLLERTGRKNLAKKTDVSPEYAMALIKAAVREIEKINKIADSEDVEEEFPEMVAGEDAPAEDAPKEDDTTEEGPAIEESGDDTWEEGTGEEDASGLDIEPEVEVTIDGEGVQIVHSDDSKLYMVLPDNSVLKMEEATEREAKVARTLLKRAKTHKATAEAEESDVEITVEGEGVQAVAAADNKLYMVLPDNSVLKVEETIGHEARLAKALLRKALVDVPKAKPAKIEDPVKAEEKAKAETQAVRNKQVELTKKETKASFNPRTRERLAKNITERDSRKDLRRS